jgi:hypothetical protein
LKRALLLLRDSLYYRRAAFKQGLERVGFKVVERLDKPDEGDVVVTWNRYDQFHKTALQFEAVGGRVLVTENGYLGKDWQQNVWYAISLGHHAGAGQWFEGGPERWDSLGVPLHPWKAGVGKPVILQQRGIGEPGIASPPNWAELLKPGLPFAARIRPHPGKNKVGLTLEQDLECTSAVITWASGAALRALLYGVPVWYAFPRWIGAQAGKPLEKLLAGEPPLKSDEARLAMFRRLAWAQWRMSEIESGEPFVKLLGV